ncbi:AmmeMemoRadiSam system protein B [Thalassotalea psychrophila]|uniref:MEMO1 family protein RGQ13_11590 n=1 Tax=Thalassotalea psychrophila TaxID=3065647 RepID=A0ABY9TPL9_9GAMM|nr:AmmeMemoRadiSam system protein B [Colwelliaceae bacterium SQ149]
MSIREPAVAGSFYCDDPIDLADSVMQCIGEFVDAGVHAKALIVPHAGYIYSGPVAGAAYRLLANSCNDIDRVVILGPCHRIALQGLAVASYEAFSTPLGDISVDIPACQNLVDKGLVQYSNEAHQFEHSLEVQLPFLQGCLAKFTILPIVVGACSIDDVYTVINALNVEGTLFLISTDMSHFHTYQQANAIDNFNIVRMLNFDTDLTGEDACGSNVLNGFFKFCDHAKWKIRMVKYENSGDTAGDKEKVVGYASFIVY